MSERGQRSTDGGDAGGTETAGDGDLRREVVVPMELYKVVTVFSTLAAVALVVGGMIALDVATDHGAATREQVDLLVAVAGVASIVAGAVVYAFASRFRAAGMGNAEESDEETSE